VSRHLASRSRSALASGRNLVRPRGGWKAGGPRKGAGGSTKVSVAAGPRRRSARSTSAGPRRRSCAW
jgi:hypothetical protein